MLYLIGLGFDDRDVSLRALDTMKKCDTLYVELYTSKWDNIETLEEKIGKSLKLLERGDVEERSSKIVDEAQTKNVALLVAGDPLTATTHMALLVEAKSRNVDTVVVHAPSIFSAVAECGLSIYKFGATTTIPYPERNYEPESFYDVIASNKERGLHTLILLDVKPPRYMTIADALHILAKVERKRGEGILTENDRLIAMHVGEKSQIAYDTPAELERVKIDVPCVLVIPGAMSRAESDALEALKPKDAK